MFQKIEKKENINDNYNLILEQLTYLLNKNDNLITSLSNTSALLYYFLEEVNWVGFYLYDGENLYLGPFQGLPACTFIKMGNGVCGVSAKKKETIVVKNVDLFQTHITCDSNSKSEIVIPIIKNNELIGVLDIDSPKYSRFSDVDKIHLQKVVKILIDNL